jgi:hypothetical protein
MHIVLSHNIYMSDIEFDESVPQAQFASQPLIKTISQKRLYIFIAIIAVCGVTTVLLLSMYFKNRSVPSAEALKNPDYGIVNND